MEKGGFRHLEQILKYNNYPTSVELKLQEKSFIVTSGASALITSADLTVTNSLLLKNYSILTVLRLQSTKKV